MKTYQNDFADFGEHAWFNAASEGPLPRVSAKALEEVVGWKSRVHELNLEKFQNVPHELKQSIAKLINVSERDVILANSVTYGIHLLANGIPWKKGDEVLLMQNDFPTDILPWLALEHQGISVKQIKAINRIITPQELKANITKKTRLVCLPHVHTFSGFKLDVFELAKICQEQGVLFILNLAQSAGNCVVDLEKLKVDAVVAAGYKWLCGPYGTGFCWIKPELRNQLDLNMNYWISTMSDQELQSEEPLKAKKLTTARAFDVFGTANFFNFVPFKASIDYFLNIGIENVEKYNQQLVDYFLAGLKSSTYDVISPKEGPGRSNLVVFGHREPQNNKDIFNRLTEEKIFLALWKNQLRFSPHVYNTKEQVDRLLTVLMKIG